MIEITCRYDDYPEPPTPATFLKVLPVQMGGVLRYKQEAYCRTNGRCTAGFAFLQGLEARKAERYKWGGSAVQLEVYCRTFRQVIPVRGS